MNLLESINKSLEEKYGLRDDKHVSKLNESLSDIMQALKNMKCIDKRSYVKNLQDSWEDDEDIIEWYEDVLRQLPTETVGWGNIPFELDSAGAYNEGGIAALLSDGSVKIYDTATRGGKSILVEVKEENFTDPEDFQAALEDAKITLGLQKKPDKNRAEARRKKEQELERLSSIIEPELPDRDAYYYCADGIVRDHYAIEPSILMDIDAYFLDELETYLQHEGNPDWENYFKLAKPYPFFDEGAHSISDLKKIRSKLDEPSSKEHFSRKEKAREVIDREGGAWMKRMKEEYPEEYERWARSHQHIIRNGWYI